MTWKFIGKRNFKVFLALFLNIKEYNLFSNSHSFDNNSYGVPVHLPYIVITCARMFRIKCVCRDPPCCLGVCSDILSMHDNFGEEDRDLKGYFTVKQ